MMIDIIPMMRAHIDEVYKIEENCFGSEKWNPDSFYYELAQNNSSPFVAIINKNIVGFIIFRHVLDEGEIYNIAVRPSCRRIGVGRALLAHIDAVAAQKRLLFVSLETRASNAAAIALYCSCGYITEYVRPNFYSAPRENALIMVKRYEY